MLDPRNPKPIGDVRPKNHSLEPDPTPRIGLAFTNSPTEFGPTFTLKSNEGMRGNHMFWTNVLGTGRNKLNSQG